MASKQEIVNVLEASHKEMLDVLNNTDVEKEVYPDWTVKEVLAHIAGWDEAIIASLSSFIQGGKPSVVAVNGIDAYNADSVAKRKKLSLDATFEDWEHQRDHLLATLYALPEKQVDDIINFPWGAEEGAGQGTISEMLERIAAHEVRHANDIKKA
ncbi:MAG: DinB family protein [Anaerolineae bacterium]|nr:DinB family protein [Anaerolineae bacterium]